MTTPQRNLRLLGGVLILFSLALSAIAFISDNASLSAMIPLPPTEDLEGFYMMSLVFLSMGLVCYMPSRQQPYQNIKVKK